VADRTPPTDGDDAQTRLDLGVAYAEMGLVHDALAELEEAVRLAPGDLRAHAKLCEVRHLLRQAPDSDTPDDVA